MRRQPSITGGGTTRIPGVLLLFHRHISSNLSFWPGRNFSRLLIRPFLIFLLLFPVKPAFAANFCVQPEIACGAQIYAYPLLLESEPEAITDDGDGSGWSDDDGSGMEAVEATTGRARTTVAVPLYDEFFTPKPIFDFSKTANLTEQKMCECPNDTHCFLDEDNIIKLDDMITLVFCGPIDEIFRHRCRGARSLIRVIGQIHESGEALTSIVETVLFCKCDRGYQRVGVEAWINGLYAFIYRCL